MEYQNGVKRLSLISFGFIYQNKPRNKFTRIIDVRNKIPNFFSYNNNDKKRRQKGKVDDFYKHVLALITDAVNDSPIALEYAFGCSRGQYRSVMFVERLRWDLEKLNITVSVQHQDLFQMHSNQIKWVIF